MIFIHCASLKCVARELTPRCQGSAAALLHDVTAATTVAKSSISKEFEFRCLKKEKSKIKK